MNLCWGIDGSSKLVLRVRRNENETESGRLRLEEWEERGCEE